LIRRTISNSKVQVDHHRFLVIEIQSFADVISVISANSQWLLFRDLSQEGFPGSLPLRLVNTIIHRAQTVIMKRLENRVAIITGGARGIGKATAEKFIQEGAAVAIWDIDVKSGSATAEALNHAGGKAKFYAVNTVDLAATEAAAAEVAKDFGRIDILINNAGITRDSSMKKMTEEQWNQVIGVNLTGVYHCTKAVSPYMLEQGYGRILNASSIVGLYGNFGQTNYVASKAGVIGMTKVWAREFGRKGVTVNAVAPGFINTEMMETVPQTYLDELKAKTPVARMGEAIDIANAYAFLASDEASFISGTVLSVDGGLIL